MLRWPADKVERWPLDRLTPYDRNARMHSEAQVAQLASSIQEWGWTMPVLVDEAGGIIAGHGRVLAARSLGLAEVPVIIARGWTDEEKRAYSLADNKIALNAGWDPDMLLVELDDLKPVVGLSIIGFSKSEMALLRQGSERRAGRTAAPERWSVVVTCRDEPAQLELLERLIEEGRTCRAIVA